MSFLWNRFRPVLESLENRENPSNLSVTFANHTLTVSGDTGPAVGIEANPSDFTQFALTGSDTFNGLAAPYSTPSGVENMVFKLSGTDETVDFLNTTGDIDLLGSLTVEGGKGSNNFFETDMTVGKNLTITNGPNATGLVTNNDFMNIAVGGNLTIKDGNGDTNTEIGNGTGDSSIGGNLTLTNGTGTDSNQFSDFTIGGNVAISNGHANSSGDAGFTQFGNSFDKSARSTIKGNLFISNLDGNGTNNFDALYDLEVHGNVSLKYGTGTFTTFIDSSATPFPTRVDGNMSLSGTGTNTIYVGEVNYEGLQVEKNLTVSTGSGADTLGIRDLQVDGATSLGLSNGNNTVDIDDSLFAGTFKLATGTGNDFFGVEELTGTTSPTEFEKSATVSLGGGTNLCGLAAGATDANQEVIIDKTFTVIDATSLQQDSAHESFPFGGTVKVVA